MLSRQILSSFRFALAGVRFCIKNERNFRIHLLAAVTALLLAPYYAFPAPQMVLLTLVIAVVVICEMFNTALEAAIDLFAKDYHVLAGIAKDISAGAVLVAAFGAAVCGVYLFFDVAVLHAIARDVAASPLKIAFVLIYLAAGYLFVRGFDQK